MIHVNTPPEDKKESYLFTSADNLLVNVGDLDHHRYWFDNGINPLSYFSSEGLSLYNGILKMLNYMMGVIQKSASDCNGRYMIPINIEAKNTKELYLFRSTDKLLVDVKLLRAQRDWVESGVELPWDEISGEDRFCIDGLTKLLGYMLNVAENHLPELDE